MSIKCRCGHDESSQEPHPCHGDGHRCGKPAKERFYGFKPVCLSGMQMKLGCSQTWACDECWAEFTKNTAVQASDDS